METKDKPGIGNTTFNLFFNPRRYGNSWRQRQYLMQILNSARKQYKLKRVKSRLRVSFIGYSYNVNTLKDE